jgi:hypothetical protein
MGCEQQDTNLLTILKSKHNPLLPREEEGLPYYKSIILHYVAHNIKERELKSVNFISVIEG